MQRQRNRGGLPPKEFAAVAAEIAAGTAPSVLFDLSMGASEAAWLCKDGTVGAELGLSRKGEGGWVGKASPWASFGDYEVLMPGEMTYRFEKAHTAAAWLCGAAKLSTGRARLLKDAYSVVASSFAAFGIAARDEGIPSEASGSVVFSWSLEDPASTQKHKSTAFLIVSKDSISLRGTTFTALSTVMDCEFIGELREPGEMGAAAGRMAEGMRRAYVSKERNLGKTPYERLVADPRAFGDRVVLMRKKQ